MKQLFISDLHLSNEVPHIEELFQTFMHEQAKDANELYVLGDLFELWIGDEYTDETALRTIHAFADYSQHGTLYFMHGNRDFLLGKQFLAQTGGTLLNEPYPMMLANQPTILMHGDSLCTEDTEYLTFKKMVREPQWQEDFLKQNIQERLNVARDIRRISMEKQVDAPDEIIDVTESEVESLMSNHKVSLLIHGHTHRQNRHPITIHNKPAERIVLGDWGTTGSVLIVEDNRIELTNFS